MDVSESNFEEIVLKSKKPVLVDFWAPWCGPCRMLAPTIDKLAVELKGKAEVVKVNVDENGALASEYGVMGIPNLKVFKNGQIVDEFTGVKTESEIKSMLQRHI